MAGGVKLNTAWDDAARICASLLPNKGGRPRGRFDDSVKWTTAENLFVRGETITNNEGLAIQHWPTLRACARRAGLNHQAVYGRSARHNWLQRQANFKAELAIKTDREVATALALETANASSILARYVGQFADAVDRKVVRTDSIADLDKAVRLLEFLKGNADSRSDQRVTLSLAAMQHRHLELRRLSETVDSAEAGLLDTTGQDMGASALEGRAIDAALEGQPSNSPPSSSRASSGRTGGKASSSSSAPDAGVLEEEDEEGGEQGDDDDPFG